VQAVGWRLPVLEPQARGGGWHRCGNASRFNTIKPRLASRRPLGRVGEERLGRLMVVELLLRVGHSRIFYEAIVSEQESLKSFHGKEQPGNTF
jgi:hypothetical protein